MDLALDGLEMAIFARTDRVGKNLAHHSGACNERVSAWSDPRLDANDLAAVFNGPGPRQAGA